MRIKFIKDTITYHNGHRAFKSGQVVDISDEIANELVGANKALIYPNKMMSSKRRHKYSTKG